jgi:hypothetical protein
LSNTTFCGIFIIMPEEETNFGAIARADEEIPLRWYEKRSTGDYVVMAVTIPAVYMQERYLPFNPLLEYLSGLAFYGAGTAADRKSTRHFLELNDEATSLNIHTGIYEANPLYKQASSISEYELAAKSKKVKAAEILGAAAALVSPYLGTLLGASRLRAALHNHRESNRIQRAIEFTNESS